MFTFINDKKNLFSYVIRSLIIVYNRFLSVLFSFLFSFLSDFSFMQNFLDFNFTLEQRKKIVLINLKDCTSNWLKMLSYPRKFHETGPAYLQYQCEEMYKKLWKRACIDGHWHNYTLIMHTYTCKKKYT